jgi:hypothetical protein
MSQIAATAPNVAGEAPLLAQGDTETNPKPDPRATKISVAATAAAVPAKMAGHETADLPLSTAASVAEYKVSILAFLAY